MYNNLGHLFLLQKCSKTCGQLLKSMHTNGHDAWPISLVHVCMPCLHAAFCISTLHAHAACPRCMSTLQFHAACPCCMSMLHVHAAWPRCMTTLHVHAACPCCISLLLVHIACPFWCNAACPWFMSIVHASCPLSMLHVHVSMMLIHAECPSCTFILSVHAEFPSCMSILHIHAEFGAMIIRRPPFRHWHSDPHHPTL